MPYLIDGTEVEVVERAGCGVVVRRIWDVGEDYDTGDPEIVPQVFEEPPTERKAEAIKALELREEELRKRIGDLQREVHEREAAQQKIQRLSNQNQALARIEDLICGRITHYLIREGYSSPEIVEAVNGGIPYTESGYYGRTKVDGLKLLVLFGNSGEDLQWKVGEYRDHSGTSWTTIEPFTSREAALARLQEIVNAFEDDNEYRRGCLHDAALKYGLQVPEALRTFMAAGKIRAALAELADAQKKAAEAEQKVQKVRQEWGTQGAN